MRFIDERHKNSFKKAFADFNGNINDTYEVVLIYLLTAINDGPHHLNSLIYKDCGIMFVRHGFPEGGWVTGQDIKIIRLAFNLFCDSVPTAKERNEPTKKVELNIKELERCLPSEVLSGLDDDLFWACIEAIIMRYKSYNKDLDEGYL